MKMNFTNLFLVAAMMVAGVSSSAQEIAGKRIVKKYDTPERKAFIASLQKERQDNYDKAYKMAELYDWPITFVDKNDSFHELQGVTEDGLPIYAHTLNSGSAVTARVNHLNTGGSTGLNLNGQDMLVGVWDQNHPRMSHADFVGRASVMDGSAVTPSMHSTHVMGTIIGSGVNNSAARGLAYQAQCWVSNWTNDISEMAMFAGWGLVISNHSYSFTPQNFPDSYYGTYNTFARNMDRFLSETPEYTAFVAAGNNRNEGKNPTKQGKDLLVSYAVSKNAVVVAAVNAVDNYTQPSDVTMSNFSSWGPTDDFRVKPDISAKGTNVLSAVHSNDTAYGYSQGTSMASPAVCAVGVLLQQRYDQIHRPEGELYEPSYMKAASLKGLLLHTADEAGPTPGPDHMFGWGLVNGLAAVNVINNNGTSSLLEEHTLSASGTFTKQIKATGNEPLKVSISWTDREGAVTSSLDDATAALVNDLDVRVVRGSVTYMPWALTKNWNNLTAQRMDNNVDPFERVDIDEPQAGAYTVIVTHKGNTLVGGSQDFSLIVTGVDQTMSASVEVLEKMKVWPNPSTGVFNVSIPQELSGEAQMQVFDVNGRMVFNKAVQLIGSNVSLDLGHLSSGVYVLKTSVGEATVTNKIVKQ